eukprot:COSAG01_NODE_53163_length_341_cov_0.702479_1_plen_20_part_10
MTSSDTEHNARSNGDEVAAA